jgi:hypothetical protein
MADEKLSAIVDKVNDWSLSNLRIYVVDTNGTPVSEYGLIDEFIAHLNTLINSKIQSNDTTDFASFENSGADKFLTITSTNTTAVGTSVPLVRIFEDTTEVIRITDGGDVEARGSNQDLGTGVNRWSVVNTDSIGFIGAASLYFINFNTIQLGGTGDLTIQTRPGLAGDILLSPDGGDVEVRDRVIVDPDGNFGNATGVSFAGNSLLYENSAGQLYFFVTDDGFRMTRFEIAALNTHSFSLRYETPTSTNPNIRPERNDPNTGIGWNAEDELSLIGGGVEGVRVSDTETTLQHGQINNITTVNAATYDLLATDYILNVTYTGTGAVTSLTLPTAQVIEGRTIVIKDAGGNAGTNNITIDTEGSETIDGSATNVINTNYGYVTLYSDGSNWFII